MINIIPKNDEKIHVKSPDCWCKPLVEHEAENGTTYENGPIVTHNAADHREIGRASCRERVSSPV